MEYPNYTTMELYDEGNDWFSFSYYYVLQRKDNKKHLMDVLGHLKVYRMIRKNKIGNGTYVDKPYWSWNFYDDLEVRDNYLKIRCDEEGRSSISLNLLREDINIVENV